jgi:hypothetical protein
MEVSFNTVSYDKKFSSEEDRNFIIEQYPIAMRKYVEDVENPLDISQILISMARSWKVRMIFVHNEDDDIETHYCAVDIATVLDYNLKSLHNWNRWIEKDERRPIEEFNQPRHNCGGGCKS